MSETTDTEAAMNGFRSESVPPSERPGHERLDGDDPTIATRVEDPEGEEWFVVGNDVGVVCTTDPAPLER
ncbi:MAG: hypothetical protein ABEJ26_03385 [Halosimplex sp.]